MKTKTNSRLFGISLYTALMISLLMTIGCGGGSSSSPPPPVSLTSISLAPQNAMLSTAVMSGLTQQFTATGIFSDHSTKDLTASVNWTSSGTAVATIGIASGLATAVSTGATTIKASDPSNGFSASTVLTVTNKISFTATAGMSTTRDQHTATLLVDGTVLVAGGQKGFSSVCGGVTNCSLSLGSAELFDQSKGSVFTTISGTMTTPRQNHGTAQLLSGKVLIVGGQGCLNGPRCTALATAEIFDPTAETFSATGTMVAARVSPTATVLADGSVLVTGGGASSAELFDPASGSFSLTGSMTTASTLATATELQNGQVLIAGGFDSAGNSLASAELYDPATRSFSPTTGSMATARAQHTASLLSDGRVLIAGGVASGVGSNAGVIASAELFDPATGQFTSAGNMTTARANHTGTLLNNGRVLLAGGVGLDAKTPLASTEVFDPTTGQFAAAANMKSARTEHTATLLSNGKGLITGGLGTSGILSTGEFFQ